MKISAEAVREIRSFAIKNAQGYTYTAAPIEIIDGKLSPHWVGGSFSWKTKTGKPIYYPSAYRKAWGKPIYVPSSRRILVGKEWLKQLEIDLIQVRLGRERGRFVAKTLAEFIYYFDD